MTTIQPHMRHRVTEAPDQRGFMIGSVMLEPKVESPEASTKIERLSTTFLDSTRGAFSSYEPSPQFFTVLSHPK